MVQLQTGISNSNNIRAHNLESDLGMAKDEIKHLTQEHDRLIAEKLALENEQSKLESAQYESEERLYTCSRLLDEVQYNLTKELKACKEDWGKEVSSLQIEARNKVLPDSC